MQLAFSNLEKIVSILLSIQFIRESDECISLNLILTVALANSGITFWTGLPISIVAIWTDVGKKFSLPSSRDSYNILFSKFTKWCEEFSAKWELAVCPWIPFTWKKKLTDPLLPIFTLSPTSFLEVGSPTRQWSNL